MKKTTQVILGVILGALVTFATISITGCKTGPDGQKTLNVPSFGALTNYATIATIAAKDGTILALRAHPEWRSGFVQARDSLRVLAAAEQVNLSSVIQIVQQLQITDKAFHGDEAKMIAGDVQIILEDTVNGKFAVFDKNQSADVAKLADAIARGITIGLGE